MDKIIEHIKQLKGIESCCFGTDREEQWFDIGVKCGLDFADSKSPWISVNEKLPLVEKHDMSIMVLVMNTEGEINFSRYDIGEWISPVPDIEFTYWMQLPNLPK